MNRFSIPFSLLRLGLPLFLFYKFQSRVNSYWIKDNFVGITIKVKQIYLRILYISAVFISMIGLISYTPTIKAATCEMFGLISSDTTWNAATCEPYIIIGNVIIENGATLTIESGTTIQFDVGKSMTIRGTLVARGTATNYITFTSNQTFPQKGDWGYIEFVDESSDAVIDAN
ncbi:MAG: hypothetical protein KF832_11765, partial [Caldilineaceae bacterium]|nr:hypothetical protein [Caldilineaceae bacterium]